MPESKQSSILICRIINILLAVFTLVLLAGLLVLVAMLWMKNNPFGYANIFHITIRRLLATAALLIGGASLFLMVRGIFRNKNRLQLGLIIMPLVLLFFLPFIPASRSQWISEQISILRSIDSSAEPVESIVHDDGTITYHLDEGLISFEDGGWVYIVTHSSHNDRSGIGYIGDIAISVDHQGQLYYNTEHICGGLTIYTDSTNGVLNLKHFLSLGNWSKFQTTDSVPTVSNDNLCNQGQ